MSNRAVFLDRDGTIIEDAGYLSDPEGIIFIENVIPALQLLQKNNFKLIITTNQSGIARRYFTKECLEEIHNKLKTIFSLNRIKMDAILFCPHHPNEKCECRKPNAGMAQKAKKMFNLDLKESITIGDKISDIEFGKNAGGKSILVLTGTGALEKEKLKDIPPERRPDYIAKDLYDAALWITKNSPKDQKTNTLKKRS